MTKQTKRLVERLKDPRLTETILIEIAIALSRQADAVEHRNVLLRNLNSGFRHYAELAEAEKHIAECP